MSIRTERPVTRIATGRRRPIVRRLLIAGWIALWAVICFVALEMVSRKLFRGWHAELLNRHMQPYLMTGGYSRIPLAGAREEHIDVGPGGPEDYGYRDEGGTYVFGFDEPVGSVAERADFLFQDRAHLLDAASGNHLRIAVLGASVAYGVGASTREKRWYAVLERLLTQGLGREVKLIPAAMPGYVSTQERIILELMILPMRPDAVIVLDGFNDAALPIVFGSRPGDPYDQGLLYKQFYSPVRSLGVWLAQRSQLVRLLLQRRVAGTIWENEKRILEDSTRMRNYVQSVASVYVDNVEHMLERCAQEGIPCRVFLQPSRDVIRRRQGATERLDPFALGGYDAILERASRMEHAEAFRDFSGIFGADGASWFFDSVHFEDPGQEALARAMYPEILEMLRAAGDSAVHVE